MELQQSSSLHKCPTQRDTPSPALPLPQLYERLNFACHGLPQLLERWLHSWRARQSVSCSIASGARVVIRYTLYLAWLMLLTSSCQAQSIKALLPSKRTSFWLRSTQTPSRPPWTRERRPTSLSRNNRQEKRFCSFAALSVPTDIMPEANTDLLFAAAMPKEEIGALDFLKVFGVKFKQSLHHAYGLFALCTLCSDSQTVMDVE